MSYTNFEAFFYSKFKLIYAFDSLHAKLQLYIVEPDNEEKNPTTDVDIENL